MKKTPKVALVLGAGGTKGFAHIGVLSALEKAGIKFDILVGCSMGAIIGAVYALGSEISKIEKRANELSRNEIIDVKIPNKYGFVRGDKAEKVIRSFLTEFNNDVEPTFKDCKLPFGCVCTDIYKGERVWITKGKLIPAVRASFSIGAVFQPVVINKRKLLDGGILSRVPVDLAKDMGADIVIAIDCIGKTKPINEEDVPGYLDTVNRVFFLMDYEASYDEMHRADLLIEIDQNDVNSIKVKNIEKSIEYGRIETEKNIETIKKLIKNWRPEVKEKDGKRS